MVIKPLKFKYRVNRLESRDEEPQNSRLAVLSNLGSVKNGGFQAKKEERAKSNPFTEAGMDENGTKMDKIKPLSSLDSNKALKKCSSPLRHSSLKVVLAATKGDRAQEKVNLTSVTDNKENTDVEAKSQTSIPLPHQQIKRSRSNPDESSDGSISCFCKNIKDTQQYGVEEFDFGEKPESVIESSKEFIYHVKFDAMGYTDKQLLEVHMLVAVGSNTKSITMSKRRRKPINVSPYRNGAGTLKCQEESKLSLFSESINDKNTVSNTLNIQAGLNLRSSTSCSKMPHDISCIVDTLPILPCLQKDLTNTDLVLNEVNALPLFESSDSMKPLEEVIAKDNDNGLSILGAAVFLSLGLDETPHMSVMKPECSPGQIDNSNNDDKPLVTNNGSKACSSSTCNTTSHQSIKESSPNLGADLTLGFPFELEEDLYCNENNAKVNEVDSLSLNQLPTAPEKNLLKKKVDITHSATETAAAVIDMLFTKKHSLKQDKRDSEMSVSQVSGTQDISISLNHNEQIGMEGLVQPQIGNKAPLCSLNTNFQIPEDRLNLDNAMIGELVGQMGTRKDYMCFSDLSKPLQGTLLLPRGQKRARRLPIQLKRLKNEALKQKKETGKKAQVNNFAKITAPSGLLADLNPGIINRVRNSKQVHAIIEAVVGSAARNAYPDSNCQNEPTIKSENGTLQGWSQMSVKVLENGDSGIVDTYQDGNDLSGAKQEQPRKIAKEKLEERMVSDMNACDNDHILDSEKSPTDANLVDEDVQCPTARGDSIPSTECNKDGFCPKEIAGEHNDLPGTFRCSCHYCLPSKRPGVDLTCAASLSMKAAIVASKWLELHYLDVRGRLAALKRSKKRIRAVINDEFGSSSVQQTTSAFYKNDRFVQVPNNDQNANMLANAEHDLHMEKWRSLFIHMENCLNVEGAQLECSLQRIRKMHSHSVLGLEEFKRIISDCHEVQQPEASEDQFKSKIASAETMERQFALGAAAASIYSTANFVTTTEDVACF
eukprot:Gb_01956 [translate_table: standard]